MSVNSQSQYNICVIIPTYNNHKTLQRVLNGVLEYTQNVIVINDGSTDTTPQILNNYNQIIVINLMKNGGKGNALKLGFKKALELGFDYAITIDSDGQHYPSDLPVFFNELQQNTEPILLIGSRNMAHHSVPKKSSFGNKFSNFWFKFETGIELTDTQSGYRAYPLHHIPKRYFTTKFEFEIEIIVRSAWKGIVVKNIPIQVLYDPSERVSHFRPFRDFTRISILNTVLVFILFAYIKPRDFFRNFKKKSFKRFLKEDVFCVTDSPLKKALSVSLGTFIGLSPFWGFHTALTITLAIFFKLNKTIAFTFSNVSIPPMIPVIIFASIWTGSVIYPTENPLSFQNITFDAIEKNIVQYLIGSFTLAFIFSIILGVLSFSLFKLRLSK